VSGPGEDALLAARLVARWPERFGGLWLRGAPEACAAVAAAVAAELPLRKLPLNVDEERLTGGLDVAASLAAERAVMRPGLLAEAEALLVPSAERLSAAAAGRIALAMDGGRPALVLLDDGVEEERAPACLTERVAFHLVLESAPAQAHAAFDGDGLFPPAEDAAVAALAAAAAALGVRSARADLFALRAAAAHAALRGAAAIGEEDLAFAARTVLAPRATQLPAPPDAEPPPPEEQSADERPRDADTLEDLVLEAAKAALPPHLLDAIESGTRRGAAPGGRGAGARHRAKLRGRPVGARAGLPRGGARLALIATLRAAAPWQRVRRGAEAERRLRLRRGDLRVRRFEEQARALTIFAVDASGSAAAQRLAEAKGAVELLLQQSYARRAEVALLAFRGKGAELLLPPTRSLTRARRLLADLPGGGGTPLAAGIDAARLLMESGEARGRTPLLVLLTDGKANIAADGRQDRGQAARDAEAAARRVAEAGRKAVLIDISPRPQPEAGALAGALRARYVHLPRGQADAVHQALAQ
jgi:magnesium chelatase subunit D